VRLTPQQPRKVALLGEVGDERRLGQHERSSESPIRDFGRVLAGVQQGPSRSAAGDEFLPVAIGRAPVEPNLDAGPALIVRTVDRHELEPKHVRQRKRVYGKFQVRSRQDLNS
jgi:hypothetical protein